MVPYYASKIAMQAMAARQVFFIAVPMDFGSSFGKPKVGYPAGTTCTQEIADGFGVAFDLYSTYVKGTAFCDSTSNQVIVPLVRFTPNPVLYTNYGNPTSYLQGIISGFGNNFQLSNEAIFQSSVNCKQAQPKLNGTMVLNYSEPLLSAGVEASDAASKDCVWSIPTFQWSDWYPSMQKEYGPISIEMSGSIGLDIQGIVHNFVTFIAYQLGLQGSISLYCDEYDSRQYDSKTLKQPKWLSIVNQTELGADSASVQDPIYGS